MNSNKFYDKQRIIKIKIQISFLLFLTVLLSSIYSSKNNIINDCLVKSSWIFKKLELFTRLPLQRNKINHIKNAIMNL